MLVLKHQHPTVRKNFKTLQILHVGYQSYNKTTIYESVFLQWRTLTLIHLLLCVSSSASLNGSVLLTHLVY